ncbi:hypothetical protein QQ008_12210 [Fulvivirgaceae bacterium BMA10]|uniref:Uncharacterized protein n=1 Tax=Splendidivirga corallicola TaxID=3051826 RepID=A0ABT8KNX9_9BACT|nr:hypothetical protein [Fulvivirgaceae bacterium BMA10]
MKGVFGVLLSIILFSCQDKQKTFLIQSPDGQVRVTITSTGDSLTYNLNWNGKEVLGISKLDILPDSVGKVIKASRKQMIIYGNRSGGNL